MDTPVSRFGDWMQTYTGRQFWPLDPRADEIDIEDIAHALSNLCRYGGHSLRFYSVAEHCVLMAGKFLSYPTLAKLALFHDAAEAYLVDVPRPIKRYLTDYAAIEARVMAQVRNRFELSWGSDLEDAVHIADNAILVDEKAQCMASGLAWGIDGLEPLGVTLQFWAPEQAKAEFLAMARFLGVTK